MKPATYLRRLAEKRRPDARIVDCGRGHIQIYGALLVNYYPESKRKTAYVAGTTAGRENVSPEQALAMAYQAPKVVASSERAQRAKQGRAKRRMLRRLPKIGGKYPCMWCRNLFRAGELTVEHIVPIARGGLDHDNNKGLACEACNQKRGHDMPELRRPTAPSPQSSC